MTMARIRRKQLPRHFDYERWLGFIYKLSGLGFNYDAETMQWINKQTGVRTAEEALRDLAYDHPTLLDGAIKLFSEGCSKFEVGHNWEDGELVTRLRCVESIPAVDRLAHIDTP